MMTSGEPWVGIVANANSGRGRGRERVEKLAEALQDRGLGSRIAWTPAERSALVRASDDDPDCRCLVAAGGDGTVGALVNEAPRRPITVLPAGTENLFARYFGMRRRPEEVAATIVEGRAVPLDLGRVADRRFTLMAGVGFDADVVSRHHHARTGRAGIIRPTNRAAYVEPVLRASVSYRFPPLTIRISDPGVEETLTGTTAFVFNLPQYALGLPFAPSAVGDDGLLDLVVFRDPGAFRALHYLWLVLCRLHLKRPGVYHRRVRRVSITSAEVVPVQFDGDPGGSVNGHGPTWSAEVLPGAIEVLVPATYPIARGDEVG